MALDASIYNAFAPRVRSVDEYNAIADERDAAKQQRILNALSVQTGQMNLQRQRAIDEQATLERNKLRDLAGVHGSDPMAFATALRGSGMPGLIGQADTIEKGFQERQKTAAQVAKDNADARAKDIENKRKVYEYAIQGLQTTRTPDEAAAYINAGVQKGAWGMQEAMGMIAQMQKHEAGFDDWRSTQLRSILAAEKQLPKMDTRDTGGAVQTLKIDPVTGAVSIANTVDKTQSPDNAATNATSRANNAASVAAQIRGQDVAASTAAAGRAQSDRHFNASRADRAAGVGPDGQAVKPATESERTAGFLLQRIRDSQRQLNAVTGQNPGSAKPGVIQETARLVSEPLANTITGADRQQVEAAQLDILDAALTLGTGAAYTREQLNGYRKSYFPQLGDKPDAVKEKAARLNNLIKAAEVKAGRSAADVNPPAPSQGVPKPGAVQDGYRFKGGNPADPKSWEKM